MNIRPTRKLTIILHADVIGSTALVQKNELLAHERIVGTFKRFSTTIDDHGGAVREIRGDALLAEFDRASDAITAALVFQKSNATQIKNTADEIRPELRVGIAMGEVIVADNTMTGEGVVIAQRLEQLADAGSLVVQSAAYETIPRRLPFTYEDLGEQNLKGFDEAIRAYRVTLNKDGSESLIKSATAEISVTSTLPDKPSIAVLPFTNMSGDPEQEYFSDGISEDLITELSRFRTLFVVARSSSFSFKGKNVDIKTVGDTLGAQYIVEGSVRRAGGRVRITVQLAEAETGNHIWAERYDRNLQDLFTVQDEVTRNIVAVLPGRIQENVADHASRKPTENMKAYELMLQGKAYRDQLSAEGNAKARECCEKAIVLDPRYARAYMYLSDSYIVDLWLGLADPAASGVALKLARQAATLDSNDVYIQDHLGFGYLSQNMWNEAEAQFEKTLAKIVNEAESMAWCGYAFLLLDRHDRARNVVLEAVRLDPLHPPALDWVLGQIYYFDGRYEEVVQLLVGEALLNSLAHAFLTGAYAHLGRTKEARSALTAFVHERRQEFSSRNINIEEETVSSLAGAYRKMWRNPVDWERIADGLRKAGLKDIEEQ